MTLSPTNGFGWVQDVVIPISMFSLCQNYNVNLYFSNKNKMKSYSSWAQARHEMLEAFTLYAGAANLLPFHQLSEKPRDVCVELVEPAAKRHQVVVDRNAELLPRTATEPQLCSYGRRHLRLCSIWRHFRVCVSRLMGNLVLWDRDRLKVVFFFF